MEARATTPATLQTIAKAVALAADTTKTRFKLSLPEEEVFASLGRFCVASITARRGQPDKKMIAKYCRKVAKWITDCGMKPCLILAGNVGTGKTTIAEAVNRYFNTIGMYSKCFIRATDLCENFLYTPNESTRKFSEGSGCHWLIIDDIGEEQTNVKEYGNTKSPVIEVVAGRYARMLPMLITTNLTLEDMTEKYGIRTVDRLREIAEWVSFDGLSFRK